MEYIHHSYWNARDFKNIRESDKWDSMQVYYFTRWYRELLWAIP